MKNFRLKMAQLVKNAPALAKTALEFAKPKMNVFYKYARESLIF